MSSINGTLNWISSCKNFQGETILAQNLLPFVNPSKNRCGFHRISASDELLVAVVLMMVCQEKKTQHLKFNPAMSFHTFRRSVHFAYLLEKIVSVLPSPTCLPPTLHRLLYNTNIQNTLLLSVIVSGLNRSLSPLS